MPASAPLGVWIPLLSSVRVRLSDKGLDLRDKISSMFERQIKALDKAGLLSSVAFELRCRSVQRARYVGGAKQLSLHLFGYESDLLRAIKRRQQSDGGCAAICASCD